jgi:hypothetical protein
MASVGSFRTLGECSVLKRPRSGNVSDQLDFTNRWVTVLDRAIANLVIEEATPLVLARKPAFRELVSAAIEFGERVGVGVLEKVVEPHRPNSQDCDMTGQRLTGKVQSTEPVKR